MEIEPQILIGALGIVISFGALVITYYRWVYLPQSEKKRKKRLNEMMKLQTQRQMYESCSFHAEQILKQVNTDDYSSFNFANLDSTFKLFNKVERYRESFRSLSDWLSACQNVIELSLGKIAKEYLATTLKEYDFIKRLQKDDIVRRFLYEEEVTKRWIEKTYPAFFHELMNKLKESEKELDTFFIQTNEAFREHRILKRFRKEKGNFVKLGEEIIRDCKEEIAFIDSELSKYSDLSDELEDSPDL